MWLRYLEWPSLNQTIRNLWDVFWKKSAFNLLLKTLLGPVMFEPFKHAWRVLLSASGLVLYLSNLMFEHTRLPNKSYFGQEPRGCLYSLKWSPVWNYLRKTGLDSAVRPRARLFVIKITFTLMWWIHFPNLDFCRILTPTLPSLILLLFYPPVRINTTFALCSVLCMLS